MDISIPVDSARHPSQLLWAKRVADRSPPPFTADEYFHVTAGQNISIHVRRKRPECQSAGRTGHFVTDTASPLSFTYFFIPSAASAGVGQPKRITRPSSDDTRLPKKKNFQWQNIHLLDADGHLQQRASRQIGRNVIGSHDDYQSRVATSTTRSRYAFFRLIKKRFMAK